MKRKKEWEKEKNNEDEIKKERTSKGGADAQVEAAGSFLQSEPRGDKKDLSQSTLPPTSLPPYSQSAYNVN